MNPKLWYTNATGDRSWFTLGNWNTAPDGTGDAPTVPPWEYGYYDYDLFDASGGAGVVISYTTIAGNATCDIPFIESGAQIFSGTFTGNNFVSTGFILGGTFSGDNFEQRFNPIDPTIILGGTFSGVNFANFTTIAGGSFYGYPVINYGDINAGTFYDVVTNYGNISGGDFLGGYFTNLGWIYGGSFNLDLANFEGSQEVAYENISINLWGDPYSGYWQSRLWYNGIFQSSFTGWNSGPSSFEAYFINGVLSTFSEAFTALGWWPPGGTGTVFGNRWFAEFSDAFIQFGDGLNGIYVINYQLTTLDSTGNGVWNGVTYVNGQAARPDGWDFVTQTYYLNNQATTLGMFGNGVWNGETYLNGQALPTKPDGWDEATQTYYLGNFPTTLNQNGNGVWWNAYGDPTYDLYFISGQETTLDLGGNGVWNGVTYVNGQALITRPDGWDEATQTYYLDNLTTTLDASGNGLWNGALYLAGAPVGVPFSSLPDPSLVAAGTEYGNGLTGTLQSNGGGGSRPQVNIGALIGLPPFIQI